MEYKFCQINPETATKEELEKEIARLKLQYDNYNNLQYALKIFLNSCYGAFGNKYYICNNTNQNLKPDQVQEKEAESEKLIE